MTNITASIQERRDLEANWIAANPVILDGALVFSTDILYTGTNQQKFKVGNGVATWSVLNYMPIGTSSAQSLAQTTAIGATTTDAITITKDSTGIYHKNTDGLEVIKIGSKFDKSGFIQVNDNTESPTVIIDGQTGSIQKNGVEVATVNDLVSLFVTARNNTGVTITKGQLVYVSGALGQNPTIALAKADVEATSFDIGIAAFDIPINTNVQNNIITNGLIESVNTSAFIDGDLLYLSATTAGAITNVAPSTPNFSQFIGFCLHSHATLGKILIKTAVPIATNTTISNSNKISPSSNAVKVNLDLKASKIGFYNVKDYGAIGDGTTDDATAIISAIAASISATGNANIIFPNGRYKVNSIITIDNSTANVNIIGHNSELVSGISTIASAVLKISSASKVFIDGLSINFNSNAVVHYGLVLGDYANTKYIGVARIENCDFYNFGVINQRGILLENTPFIGGVAGNYNLPSAIISNCNFYNKNLLGASVNYTTNILYGIAIQLGEQTDYARIINCNFNFISIGIWSTAGANMDVTACNFLGCLPKQATLYTYGCIYVPNTGANNGKVNVVGCKFNHNLGYSIYWAYATAERPLTVSGCHFIANGTTAIYMTHTSLISTHSVIQNNYFERCSQAFTNSWTGQPFGATLQPFIYLNNQSNTVVKNNKFLNDASYAVQSASNSNLITAQSNQISNTTGTYLLVGVNNILEPFVTPEMYGAVGDGVTADQVAIQAAIDSGYPVFLSEKNYRITSELSVVSNVTIIGSGKLSIISAPTNIVLIRMTGDYNTFKNFTFYGTVATGGAGGANWGVWADGVAGLTSYRISNIVSGCYFINLTVGIITRYMVGTSSGTKHEGSFIISDCVFTGCATGFSSLTRGEYNTITNSSFYSNTTGVSFTGGNNSIIGGKIVDNTTGLMVLTGTNDGHSVASGVMINHNTTNLSCTNTLGYTFNSCLFFAGSISLTGTGKNKFIGCEFSMGSNTLTVTNSPAVFNGCEFSVIPGTYTLTGTPPVMIGSYSGTAKMATPKVSYSELNTLAANGTFTVPFGMSIESIVYENTTANAVTGGIRIGTTNGGAEVVSAQAIVANGVGQIKDANILLNYFSSTVAQILYIQAVTAWNSASIKFYIKLKPLV